MVFTGVIIEESLIDVAVLEDVDVTRTDVEPVTATHRTPWVSRWTLHTVQIPEGRAAQVADRLSRALDRDHDWYADFRTETEHYVVYSGRVFHITDRSDKAQYDEASAYGLSLGIPDYQVDFSPHVTQWER